MLHALEDIIHREGPDASGDHQWLFNAKVIFLDTFPHLADVWDALTPLASKRCFMLIKTHVLTYLMHSQIGHIPLDEKDHRQPAPGANNSIAVYVCLSFCLSVFLYVCLSVYLSISISLCLPIYLCAYLPSLAPSTWMLVVEPHKQRRGTMGPHKGRLQLQPRRHQCSKDHPGRKGWQ